MNRSEPKPGTAYCDSCGETVETTIIYHKLGEEMQACSHCGLPIGKKPGEKRKPAWKNVIIADDTELVREVMSEIITKSGFAQSVITCQNGEEFLSKATELIAGKNQIGMVFLDVVTPILDGVSAAISLRAIEKGLRIATPIPILFFTVKRCSDLFRKTLHRVSPALYVNKEADPSPQKLAERINNVVLNLASLHEFSSTPPKEKAEK